MDTLLDHSDEADLVVQPDYHPPRRRAAAVSRSKTVPASPPPEIPPAPAIPATDSNRAPPGRRGGKRAAHEQPNPIGESPPAPTELQARSVAKPDPHPPASAAGLSKSSTQRASAAGGTNIDGQSPTAPPSASAVDGGPAGSLLADPGEAWVSGARQIVGGWRLRQRWHRAEKALTLQAKALCRACADGDKEMATKFFDQIYREFRYRENVAAGKRVRAPREVEGAPEPPLDLLMGISPFLSAIYRFETEREKVEKGLIEQAKCIPAYEWAVGIRGFGDINFVAIVGECGDIGSYKSVSALWKRMGLAVFDGQRQRCVTDKELAILMGYNPSRRSVAFNLGECLIKAGSPYKAVYDARKEYELARDPEMRPIIAHRRAARYMTKRVLRKLYGQWRLETRGASGDPDDALGSSPQ